MFSSFTDRGICVFISAKTPCATSRKRAKVITSDFSCSDFTQSSANNVCVRKRYKYNEFYIFSFHKYWLCDTDCRTVFSARYNPNNILIFLFISFSVSALISPISPNIIFLSSVASFPVFMTESVLSPVLEKPFRHISLNLLHRKYPVHFSRNQSWKSLRLC